MGEICIIIFSPTIIQPQDQIEVISPSYSFKFSCNLFECVSQPHEMTCLKIFVAARKINIDALCLVFTLILVILKVVMLKTIPPHNNIFLFLRLIGLKMQERLIFVLL